MQKNKIQYESRIYLDFAIKALKQAGIAASNVKMSHYDEKSIVLNVDGTKYTVRTYEAINKKVRIELFEGEKQIFNGIVEN
jgi:hypothetical protein